MMKTLSTAIVTSILLAIAAPVFAADTPHMTKAECLKKAGMKWDAKTSACVKK